MNRSLMRRILIVTMPIFVMAVVSNQGVRAASGRWPSGRTYKQTNRVSITLVHQDDIPKVNISISIQPTGIDMDSSCAAALYMRAVQSKALDSKLVRANTVFDGIGGHLDVGISNGWLTYSVDVLSIFANQAIDELSQIVLAQPTSDIGAALEKKEIRTASRPALSPQEIAFEQIQELLGPNSSEEKCQANSIYGIGEAKEMLRAFDQKLRLGSHIHVFVIGEFDDRATRKEIAQQFSYLRGSEAHNFTTDENRTPLNIHNVGVLSFIDRPRSTEATVYLATRLPGFGTADYARMEIASAIVGGQHRSLLTSLLQKQMRLSYAPSAAVTVTKGLSIWIQSLNVPSNDTLEALNAVVATLNMFVQSGPSDNEVANAKVFIMGNVRETSESRQQTAAACRLAAHFGDPIRVLKRHYSAVQNISANDVHSAAEQYMRPQSLIFVIVGDRNKIGDKLRLFSAVHRLKFID